MGMAIYSRSAGQASALCALFARILPGHGIVTDCNAYHDAAALLSDVSDKEIRYFLLCCENEADMRLASAVKCVRPNSRIALAVASDDLAVQSYLLDPCYCCRTPLNRAVLDAILYRFSA